jgi:hypothetical protein
MSTTNKYFHHCHTASHPFTYTNNSITLLKKMYKHFMDQLLLFLKITKLTYTTPYEWNTKKSRFMIITHSKYVKAFRILSNLNLLHFGVIFWNLIQTLRKESSPVYQMIGVTVTAYSALTSVCRWMHAKRGVEIVDFLNYMVQSKTSLSDGGKINKIINKPHTQRSVNVIIMASFVLGDMSFSTRIIKFFMRTIYIPLVCFLMTSCALAFFSPRIPPFLGYFLCRSSLDWWLLSGEDICGLNDDGLFNIMGGNVLFNVFRIVGGCTSFIFFTTSVLNLVLMAFYEVFPSILFQNDQLAQIQMAVKGCTFPNHASLILKYRQLQVLNIMFNKIYETKFFEFGMSASVLLVISNGYFVLTMPHLPPLFLMLLAYTILMEYLCVITLFCMASRVWSRSVELEHNWRKNDLLFGKSLTRRYGKSLHPLKVKIGSVNFVELNTPFVFLSFCIQQTISLMLLKEN